MGIINITPDSFSDGGKFNTIEDAVKRAVEFEKNGADIIDIGGESTGPKSVLVPLEEELKRVIPALKAIRKKVKIPISIDTYKAEVAKQALDNGAEIINDVTALRGDRSMVDIVAVNKAPVIMMYSKDNSPRTTVKEKKYKDVLKVIERFFEKQIAYAVRHGVASANIILDPGMGQFISSIPTYSFEIIARLNELKKFKKTILIGISRKSFLGGEMNVNTPQGTVVRDERGKALAALAYLNGASIIRTHDVKGVTEFFKIFKC